MVLQGFQNFTYMGWICGVLLLKSPKKSPPEALPKRSLFLILVIFINILSLFFRLDFYLTHLHRLNRETMIAKFLDLSVLIGETCFSLFFRMIFALRSKMFVKLLRTLISDLRKVSETLVLPETDRREWITSTRLVKASFIFHLVSAALVTNWVGSVLYIPSTVGSSGSKLLGFIPKPLYIILFYFLGELPVATSITVTFSFVIVSTFHVLWIFYDLCEAIRKDIILSDDSITEDDKNLLFIANNTLGEVKPMSVFTVTQNVGQTGTYFKQNDQPIGKDKLLGKLEHLKLVCSQYDKICGLLLLGLIVRSVYVLISSANSILLYENPTGSHEGRAKYYLDIFLFPTELVQLWLLPLGAMFRKKINERKETLTRDIIFLQDLDVRSDLRNVMTAFNDWDWTLTGGPGFFTIDKSLLSGIVSSLMTYVTIIFQLNAPATTNVENVNE